MARPSASVQAKTKAATARQPKVCKIANTFAPLHPEKEKHLLYSGCFFFSFHHINYTAKLYASAQYALGVDVFKLLWFINWSNTTSVVSEEAFFIRSPF